jgi:hypothetical protein
LLSAIFAPVCSARRIPVDCCIAMQYTFNIEIAQ